MLAEKRFRSGSYAKSLFKLFTSAVCYPRALGRKALDMLFFFFKKAFGDKHRHINVFVTRLFKAFVKNALNILPDSIAVRPYNHTALYA